MEGRNGIKEFRMIFLHFFFHIFHDEPVVIHSAGNELSLEHFKYHVSMDECRRFYQDGIARIKVQLAHEVQRLDAAGSYHDIIRLSFQSPWGQQLVPYGFPQSQVADLGAISHGVVASCTGTEHFFGNFSYFIKGYASLAGAPPPKETIVGETRLSVRTLSFTTSDSISETLFAKSGIHRTSRNYIFSI